MDSLVKDDGDGIIVEMKNIQKLEKKELDKKSSSDSMSDSDLFDDSSTSSEKTEALDLDDADAIIKVGHNLLNFRLLKHKIKKSL